MGNVFTTPDLNIIKLEECSLDDIPLITLAINAWVTHTHTQEMSLPYSTTLVL